MTFLLDTHVLLWAAQGSARLSDRGRSLIDGTAGPVYFSVASIWEVVIKSALGRQDFRVAADRLRDGALLAGYDELPIRGPHVLAVADLPARHADPFDRILLAQATAEGLRLLTADRVVLDYGTPAYEI